MSITITSSRLAEENEALIRVLQCYLNEAELAKLNNDIYQFVKQCLTDRPQPYLKQAIYLVKMKFKPINVV